MPARSLGWLGAAIVTFALTRMASAGMIMPADPAPGLGTSPAAYSIAKITELLETRGYRGIEFTDRMLGRKTFGTIASLSAAVAELLGAPAAT